MQIVMVTDLLADTQMLDLWLHGIDIGAGSGAKGLTVIDSSIDLARLPCEEQTWEGSRNGISVLSSCEPDRYCQPTLTVVAGTAIVSPESVEIDLGGSMLFSDRPCELATGLFGDTTARPLSELPSTEQVLSPDSNSLDAIISVRDTSCKCLNSCIARHALGGIEVMLELPTHRDCCYRAVVMIHQTLT